MFFQARILRRVEKTYKELYQITKSINNTREKRESLLPIVGKIQKLLIGTLDEDSGIWLHNIAMKAYNKSSNLAELVRNLLN